MHHGYSWKSAESIRVLELELKAGVNRHVDAGELNAGPLQEQLSALNHQVVPPASMVESWKC